MNDTETLADLTTEAADPRWHDLDTLSVADLAQVMNQADASVPGAVRAALPEIVAAIDATVERMAAGGRLIYVGAGTPGRLAILDASECPPTFSTPPEQVTAVMAGGLEAVVNAVEGAEDDAAAGVRAIDELAVGPLDTVVGIASSGRTPFVLAAVQRAGQRGGLTVGLSCNRRAALSQAVDHGIEVEVGPEVVSGSTRLKAGTAQKLVLNMFSTITMIRLGKTYGSLMIDVKATNHKLRERAIRIVGLIAQADREDALTALTAADFRVKPAVVMLARGLDLAAAEASLERAQGRLRRALEEI
ncbi:MAG: N-acetylmuramic acid 6-phosphate etherase [Propionibacteriaceae bacterium]|nr:N-acetylmuramic acid 6-phosphate etherase [Propionibacteriaceae bacterium]